jgi:hypothetical protein
MVSRRTPTDATTFRSVDDTTISLDTIISSARKDKAAQVQAWIDQFHPPPIEILRRIAEVSPPHQRVLTLISAELSKFPPANLQEPILDVRDDAIDQMSNIKSRLNGVLRQTEELEGEEEELQLQLTRAKGRQAEAKREYDRYVRLIGVSTFNAIEAERLQKRRDDSEQQMAKPADEHSESTRYNELWGENRHLKAEIEKLKAKIDDQRAYHVEYSRKKAIAAVNAKLALDPDSNAI